MDEIIEKAKELQREYHKNWRANNKDKVKAINEKYWLTKALKQQKIKEFREEEYKK